MRKGDFVSKFKAIHFDAVLFFYIIINSILCNFNLTVVTKVFRVVKNIFYLVLDMAN